MTVSISFAPAEEARLRERAAAEGKDVQTFVREAALEKMDRPTMHEILAPIHAATESSGVSLDEIEAMAEQAKHEARQQRRSSRPSANG